MLTGGFLTARVAKAGPPPGAADGVMGRVPTGGGAFRWDSIDQPLIDNRLPALFRYALLLH